ncbi:uncharacterized protein LOC111358683 [Spodoptera litura]|uniref:Uncharacterized protein LOC111358683 n=1 Tax=Spodoptera litura TaxID=69820 RepID=A0A9J7J096_SPOLT|nr:uncharacterized protein LOC111358683 [Spodoptera litura]
MSDEEPEENQMRKALTEIAKEVQKLHKNTISAKSKKCDAEEILGQLLKCKSSLNLRTIQIKRLKNSLKTACAVAKTMSSTKASEIATLTSHLDFARKNYLNLIRQQSEKDEIITNLSTENHALRDQLQFFENVIRLGYQELQKRRDEEHVENISSLEQLKHILASCGQFYADYCNEHEKRIQLEQKNKFLNTLMTMENNLKPKEKVGSVCINKDKKCPPPSPRQRIGFARSEFKIGSHQRNFTNLTMTKIELNKHLSLSPTNSRDLDLTTHLKTVKQLLNDQDNLIKDLKSLSKAINVDESY